MKRFKIVHFDDYHDIDFYKTTFKHRFELGCFRPKTGYNYNRYYAVFYNQKPTKQQIVNSLNQLIQKDIII